MGLFDADPETSGLLGMAASMLQAGGPSRTPVSFGQALGQSYIQGQSMAQKARLLQQQEQMQQLQQMLMASQIASASKKEQEEKALREIIMGGYGPTTTTQNVPQTVRTGDLDPRQSEFLTDEERARYDQGVTSNVPVSVRSNGFDVNKIAPALMAMGRPELIEKYAAANAALAPKFEVIETYDPSGAKVKIVVDARTKEPIRQLGGSEVQRLTAGPDVYQFGANGPERIITGDRTYSPGQTVVRGDGTRESIPDRPPLTPDKARLAMSLRGIDPSIPLESLPPEVRAQIAADVDRMTASAAPKVAVNTSDPTAVAKVGLDVQKQWIAETKNAAASAQQYQVMYNAATNPSAKGDTSMLYTFFKILDPESTVREGELGLVMASRSIPDKFKSYAQKLSNGQMLLPQERSDLLNQAYQYVSSQQPEMQQKANLYRGYAQSLGLDPEAAIPDPFKGVKPPPQAGGGSIQDRAAAELRRRLGAR